MMPTLKIYNGRVITPAGILPRATVWAQGATITAVTADDTGEAEEEIDAGGLYVSPGFVDIHVHGGGGHDFMDATVEAFTGIAQVHARYGTTAMVPTTLTSDTDGILRSLQVYERALAAPRRGARFLGMHLEGPYFAMNQRGAQDPRYIRLPDPEEYRKIIASSSAIRRWSAAPELDGALPFGRYLTEHGIIAALAHTDAVYEEVEASLSYGYSLVTHLYSGMSGVTRRHAFRYAGAVEAAYLLDELDVELIADGVHLPPPLLQLAYRIKGAQRLALITDAMRAAGTDARESVLGSLDTGLQVIVEDGVAKLPDRSAFAGSVATADRLLRTMMSAVHLSLEEALPMLTSTPARIMGVGDRLGSLEPGKEADIILFDDDIRVRRTIVGGHTVYGH